MARKAISRKIGAGNVAAARFEFGSIEHDEDEYAGISIGIRR